MGRKGDGCSCQAESEKKARIALMISSNNVCKGPRV